MSSGRRLAHDWYDGVIPDNVVFHETTVIDSSHSFLRFRSRKDDALTLGRGAQIYSGSGFDLGPDARVRIGAFTMINNAQIICDETVSIGDYGLISWNVVIIDNRRVPSSIDKRRAYIRAILQNDAHAFALQTRAAPVVIGENVWIGHDSVVLPGVEIGSGSIIGARSVVAESVPEFAVAAGNPARVIRRLTNAN
jgi:acetyltransferase-like isoleucine patch superfamily enzyme